MSLQFCMLPVDRLEIEERASMRRASLQNSRSFAHVLLDAAHATELEAAPAIPYATFAFGSP